MKLTVKSEYACLAMIALAEQFNTGEVITIARISEQKSIPKKFLEQILLALKRGGYVRSRKGPEGGYSLAKKPEEINVAEIVRLMDGALAPVESVSKYFFEHTPIEKSPKLLNVFKSIRDYISETLEGVTFRELIE
ncbi:MAG: Rrf2 family transcriptional regulator [Chitinispirillaceae bacterium]|nr:Rrf2 family transcriptional regulator [Chitinispirillaceae bacterium]